MILRQIRADHLQNFARGLSEVLQGLWYTVSTIYLTSKSKLSLQHPKLFFLYYIFTTNTCLNS